MLLYEIIKCIENISAICNFYVAFLLFCGIKEVIYRRFYNSSVIVGEHFYFAYGYRKCFNCNRRVKKMGERFEIKGSTNDKFYFVLIAPNNEVIAKSEMYENKDGCKKGITAVKKYASTAPIVDKTA